MFFIFSRVWDPASWGRLDAWKMLIGSFSDFDFRSVHISFSDPDSPISGGSLHYRKGRFLYIFSFFSGSGAWICQLGAWNCQLGAWKCQLGAWNCLLGVWNCQVGAWICVLGAWICLLATSTAWARLCLRTLGLGR